MSKHFSSKIAVIGNKKNGFCVHLCTFLYKISAKRVRNACAKWQSSRKVLSMATTRFYLDARRSDVASPSSLKLVIGHRRTSAVINLEVKLRASEWDARTSRVKNHPNKIVLNRHISEWRLKVDRLLLELSDSGELARYATAVALRDRVLQELDPNSGDEDLFARRFLAFANMKGKSTKEIYLHTYKRMQGYAGEGLDRLRFEDITKEWLTGFDMWMSQTSPSKNARNIHLRNIRAVFNEAIDDEVTTFYPFRRFKIRPVATAKRSLKVEQLRELFSYPVEEYAVQYVDMFKLIFFLCGINIVDLCRLKKVVDGRVEYNRAKTHRLYSIKVEPEAMEIIEKYRGRGWLLDILDRYGNYQDYMHRMNKGLQRIGEMHREGRGGKKVIEPRFPGISTYWARHSWATIAASLDIPKDTIAAALGHGGNTVTDIYIDFDRRKVDEANRRVMDWVLYGKK